MNILLFRHARNDYHGDNAGYLNDAGRAYADFIVDAAPVVAVKDQISEVWSNNAPRCINTIAPLAESIGVEIQQYGQGVSAGVSVSAESIATKLKQSNAPGWAVICARSLDLDGWAREILPDASDIAQYYERYMSYSGQTAASRDYARIEIYAFASNVVYTDAERATIQTK